MTTADHSEIDSYFQLRHDSVVPAAATPAPSDDHDVTCLCGRLVARWVNGNIELRCQRCKRTLCLELTSDRSGKKTIRVRAAS
jgi:hypothetical protein